MTTAQHELPAGAQDILETHLDIVDKQYLGADFTVTPGKRPFLNLAMELSAGLVDVDDLGPNAAATFISDACGIAAGRIDAGQCFVLEPVSTGGPSLTRQLGGNELQSTYGMRPKSLLNVAAILAENLTEMQATFTGDSAQQVAAARRIAEWLPVVQSVASRDITGPISSSAEALLEQRAQAAMAPDQFQG